MLSTPQRATRVRARGCCSEDPRAITVLLCLEQRPVWELLLDVACGDRWNGEHQGQREDVGGVCPGHRGRSLPYLSICGNGESVPKQPLGAVCCSANFLHRAAPALALSTPAPPSSPPCHGTQQASAGAGAAPSGGTGSSVGLGTLSWAVSLAQEGWVVPRGMQSPLSPSRNGLRQKAGTVRLGLVQLQANP